MFIDTHCHLDMFEDIKGILERAKKQGINYIITVGIDLESSQKAVQLAETYDYIWAAIGIHPHNAKMFDEKTYIALEKLAQHPKVVAIGEIGLDFYRHLSPAEIQIKAFKAQIKLAKNVKKPLIIHCREAILETWQILEETQAFNCSGVWHCFPGDIDLARKCIEKNFYISIPGIVTFPKAERLQKVVKEISLDYLLLETDAPFLAPVPMRGKTNEPAFIYFIAEKIASLKNTSLQEVASKTTKNAMKLFHFCP